MKALSTFFTVLVLTTLQAHAMEDSSFAVSYSTGYSVVLVGATTYATVMGTAISLGEDIRKELIASQEDVAYYLTTDGQVCTARAEYALNLLRSVAPQIQASDFDLAQAILAL